MDKQHTQQLTAGAQPAPAPSLQQRRDQWRRTVEASGFTPRESGRLLFVAYLMARGRMES